MKTRLKPMGIGTILDNTFSILRERFWAFQGANILAMLPFFIILAVIGVIIITTIGLTNLRNIDEMMNHLGISIVFIMFLGLAACLAYLMGTIYLSYGNIKLFRSGMHNEKCSLKEVFQGIRGKRWRCFLINLLIFLMGLPFMILYYSMLATHQFLATLIYYAAILTVQFLFCLAVVVLFIENHGVIKTLGRAFGLPAKYRWRILGTLLLVYLLLFLMIMIFYSFLVIGIGVAIGLRNIVAYAGAGLLGIIGLLVLNSAISFLYGPLVGIYYDLLIRKEGYDIQQQLREESGTGFKPDDEPSVNI